jgi:L-ascorbate 6-phosphate lactonase
MKQKSTSIFWEDSFRTELEGTAANDGVTIWALGGACFALRTPQATIYLDPFLCNDPLEGPPGMYRTTRIPLDPGRIALCDAALISHNHYDHCCEQTLEAMSKNTGMQMYGPSSAVDEMQSYDLPKSSIRRIDPGDSFRVQDATVAVWPAYDKDEPHAVSYLIESSGVRVFFTGDSVEGAAFDEVGAVGVDIAMLAFGRTWYMDEYRMLDAAERLRPKLLLPYHWELWRGHTGDPLELGRLVERRKPPFRVDLLQIGDCIHCRSGGEFAKGNPAAVGTETNGGSIEQED